MLDWFNELPSLDVPSEHLFTYSECFAQVEPGMRIHRFVMLPNRPEEPVAVFYVRRDQNALKLVWRRRDLDAATSSRILGALAGIRIPLNPEVRSWTSMHFNRSLRLDRRGVSIDLWWDSGDSVLADALAPLIHAIAQLVIEIKAELEQQDLVCQWSDDLVPRSSLNYPAGTASSSSHKEE